VDASSPLREAVAYERDVSAGMQASVLIKCDLVCLT